MRALLLSLVFAALLPLSAGAAELRLVTAELPPYTYHQPPPTVSEFGQPMGIVYEAVEEMARRIGHSGEIEFMSWTLAQDLAQSEPNIGILSLTRTPERDPRYRWLVKIVTDDLILVGGQGVDVSSLDAVRDRPIGVLRRSGAETLLQQRGFTRIEPASEEWINADKLKRRVIDAWLAPRLMVLHAYREVGGNAETLGIGQIVRPSEIWLAGSRSISDEEAARWQQAFEAMQADGTYDRILARYRRVRVEPIPDELRRNQGPVW